MTCKNCKHFPKCTWLLSFTGEEISCDWIPSRFQPIDRHVESVPGASSSDKKMLCNTCNGEKRLYGRWNDVLNVWEECPACKGTGMSHMVVEPSRFVEKEVPDARPL